MKLLVWLLFGVMIALMPFYVRYIINYDRGQSATLGEILGDGELLVVSVVINAAAIGELMSKEIPAHFRLARIIAIGVSVFLLCVMSTWFADVSSIHAEGGKLPSHHNMAGDSLVFFCSTLLASGSCLVLSEVET